MRRMAVSERICAREVVKLFAKSAGTSVHKTETSEQIEATLKMLPFEFSETNIIASNGLNPGNRDVAVFLTKVNGEKEKKVIKVGISYDKNRHGSAQGRAINENRCSDIFERSELSEYLIPSRSIVVGSKDLEVDVRVQDFGRGVPFCDIDLAKLNIEDISALIKYHSAVLNATIKNGFQCEPGYSFKRENLFQEIARIILMGTPLVSQNVLYDNESKKVSIIDPGYSIPIDNLVKKLVFGGIVGLECIALKTLHLFKC